MTAVDRSYTLSVEHGAAIVRVFRPPGAGRTAMADTLALLAEARELTRNADVHGVVLDLRRVGGVFAPELEDVYRQVATAWEQTGQPIAFLTVDPVQKLQLTRIVAQGAPRMGAVFSDRNEARRFVGASSSPDASSADLMSLARGSKRR